MTIRAGSRALAEDVAAIAAQVTSANSAAGTALANATTALANSVAAQASAAAAEATAAVALAVPALPVVTSAPETSLVPIGQGGSTVAITLANLLDGVTVAEMAVSAAAADTDTFPTDQGSGTLSRQTLAAVWTWVAGHLPGYKRPVLEVSASRTLDATCNGLVLVVTGAGVVLTPNAAAMGSGFQCEVVTAGAGSVTWGAGITATNGAVGLMSANLSATVIVVASSAGTLVLACTGAAATTAAVAAPGPVTGLTLSTVTAASLALSWAAPATGGAATYYEVQYRIYGSGSAWTAVATNPTTTSITISGLAAATQYDIQVAANNTGGVASAFTVYGQSPPATTSAAPVTAPATPTGLAIGAVTAASATLTWASASGATGYIVAFSSNGGTTFSAPVNAGNVLTYTFAGLAAATAYVFQVAATNSAGISGAATVNATTSVASATGSAPFNAPGYLLTMGTRTAGGPFVHGSSGVTLMANDNSIAADGAHTTPASVSYGWSTSNTVAPTAGLVAMSNLYGGSLFVLDGHNQWWVSGSAPASAGSWYLWFVAANSAGTVVAAFVSPSPYTIT
jgi:hypothetical protein